jgi:hypothetical protein
MAQTIPTPDLKLKPEDQKLVPPDERFWQRYSPHGELPLSGASSVAIHLLTFGLMMLLGWMAIAVFSHTSRSLPVEAVRYGGGGGNPHGVGDAPNAGKPVEAGGPAEEKSTNPVPDERIARPELKPDAGPKEQFKFNEESTRYIHRSDSEGAKAFQRLNQANQRVRLPDKEPKESGYGKGGKGSGGGSGDGVGTGTGSGRGEGGGTLTQREKRMLRWSMVFDTRSGRDYVSQLQGLGAILAVPVREEGNSPDYKIIRNLSARPAKLLDEDIGKIQRIYWVDDKPQSVNDVMAILGVPLRPSHFVAFMPEELEQKLFKLEKDWLAKNYGGRTEDDIVETRFRIKHTKAGGYEPEVTSQKVK